MRKAIASLLLFGSLLVGGAARADGGPFGVGIMIGSPTGVSLKYYLDPGKVHAIDGGVGFVVLGAEGLHIHADYLWHPITSRQQSFDLRFYLGIGGRMLEHSHPHDSEHDLHLGARVPFGLLFAFDKAPLDVFLELAFVADVIHGSNENTWVGLNAALGVRYYF